MAIGDQDSGPTTIVKVIELHSPPQPVLDLAQSRAVGNVIKVIVTTIEVERWGVVAEVRFDDVLIAVVGKVVCRKAHACLLGTILVVRHAGFLSDVGERSVLVVVIQNAGGGVAGNVDIRPSIMVEIRCQRGESVTSRCIENAGFLGDVDKCAIAIVVIKRTCSRLEPTWPAHYVDPLPLAPAPLAWPRHHVVIEVHVTHHENIYFAVAVVIHKTTTGAPLVLRG